MFKKLLIMVTSFLILGRISLAQPPLPPNPPPSSLSDTKATTNTILNTKPLVEIKLSISKNILTAISDTLKKIGFEIIIEDRDELLLEAKKMDGTNQKVLTGLKSG